MKTSALGERLAPTPPAPHVLRTIVERALEEDIGRGDLTTASVIDADTRGRATFRARETLSLAGLPVIRAVFAALRDDVGGQQVKVTPLAEDGVRLSPGTEIARLEGSARAILLGERVALNFIQRMSGVASVCFSYVAALPEGSACRIADTRKTTPGLRALERYAVRCGGAHNHRNDLSSAVMIKDNHIAACGGVAQAIRRAQANAPHTCRIECEVDRMDQLVEAIAAEADVVMLDNFDDDAVTEGVAYIRANQKRPTLIEASGGITLPRIAKLATLGVDVISVGALTHSARGVDIGLDWDLADGNDAG